MFANLLSVFDGLCYGVFVSFFVSFRSCIGVFFASLRLIDFVSFFTCWIGFGPIFLIFDRCLTPVQKREHFLNLFGLFGTLFFVIFDRF